MSALLEELLAIRTRHGVLTPVVVVEESTPNEAPLHDRFEWNDSVAGHQYRISQAQALIRSVKVSYIEPNGMEGKMRAFVSVAREDGVNDRTYEPVEDVAADPRMRQLALRDAQREWLRLRAKYEHLGEFFEMVRRDLDGQGVNAA